MNCTRRYLLNQPETREDKLQKVHTFYANGPNSVVWKPFVERFDKIKIKELYGSTQGNFGTSKWTLGMLNMTIIGDHYGDQKIYFLVTILNY